jgi:hypothetical protein
MPLSLASLPARAPERSSLCSPLLNKKAPALATGQVKETPTSCKSLYPCDGVHHKAGAVFAWLLHDPESLHPRILRGNCLLNPRCTARGAASCKLKLFSSNAELWFSRGTLRLAPKTPPPRDTETNLRFCCYRPPGMEARSPAPGSWSCLSRIIRLFFRIQNPSRKLGPQHDRIKRAAFRSIALIELRAACRVETLAQFATKQPVNNSGINSDHR